MKAMVVTAAGRPLQPMDMADPEPGAGEVLVRVLACGVCRTDLHIVDGELEGGSLPVVPGHQVVGEVVGIGAEAEGVDQGQRVGLPWLGWTCGECAYCRGGQENLCDRARFTGFHLNGGYAERMVADARYLVPLPSTFPTLQAAPLLCAGLIGYRAYRMIDREPGDVRRLGLYGFGAAAHIVAQIAVFEGREVFAFTRPGDPGGQAFARRLGAVWAGASDQSPPTPLDAAIIFAPVGPIVPQALRAVRKGGTVVCAGIHMSDIPTFPYAVLWGERVLRSVANLTRQDAKEFIELAPRVPVRTEVQSYDLVHANSALADLREGRINGAAVLSIAAGRSR